MIMIKESMNNVYTFVTQTNYENRSADRSMCAACFWWKPITNGVRNDNKLEGSVPLETDMRFYTETKQDGRPFENYTIQYDVRQKGGSAQGYVLPVSRDRQTGKKGIH